MHSVMLSHSSQFTGLDKFIKMIRYIDIILNNYIRRESRLAATT